MTSGALSRRLRPYARVSVTASAVLLSVIATASAATAGAPPTSEVSDLFGPPQNGLTVMETIGLFLLAPAGIFALIALAVMGPSMGRGSRSRSGPALGDGPVWVDPAGAARGAGRAGSTRPPAMTADDEQGGVHARW